jgi:hypothetical protein
MEESRPPVRALLAFEDAAAAARAMEEAVRQAAGCCGRFTVAAVAAPPHPTLPWAALAGLAPDEDRQAAIAEACRSARSTARLAPPNVAVEHRAEHCWRALLLAAVAGAYDVIIVGAPPQRWRDRRRLRRASKLGLRLVLAKPI